LAEIVPVPKRRDSQIGDPPYGDPAIRTYEQLRMLVLCRSGGDLVWRGGVPVFIIRPGLCERCGHWYAAEAHHRRLRSQQGRDVASNLAALCRDCHNEVHAHPVDAGRDGWMLVAGDEPAEVPVKLAGGLRARLNDRGEYEYVAPGSGSVTDDLRAVVEEVARAREGGAGALAQ
jgi:hypothetical protein